VCFSTAGILKGIEIESMGGAVCKKTAGERADGWVGSG